MFKNYQRGLISACGEMRLRSTILVVIFLWVIPWTCHPVYKSFGASVPLSSIEKRKSGFIGWKERRNLTEIARKIRLGSAHSWLVTSKASPSRWCCKLRRCHYINRYDFRKSLSICLLLLSLVKPYWHCTNNSSGPRKPIRPRSEQVSIRLFAKSGGITRTYRMK